MCSRDPIGLTYRWEIIIYLIIIYQGSCTRNQHSTLRIRLRYMHAARRWTQHNRVVIEATQSLHDLHGLRSQLVTLTWTAVSARFQAIAT